MAVPPEKHANVVKQDLGMAGHCSYARAFLELVVISVAWGRVPVGVRLPVERMTTLSTAFIVAGWRRKGPVARAH